MTKLGEELPIASGCLGMESLPPLGFPLSGLYPQQPTTHLLHSVARETSSFLHRQGLTTTHPQWGYRMRWFTEVQDLGCSALTGSCYEELWPNFPSL